MEIDGQTLIERSLTILMKNGIKNIIISCGHLSKMYKDIQEKHGFRLVL